MSLFEASRLGESQRKHEKYKGVILDYDAKARNDGYFLVMVTDKTCDNSLNKSLLNLSPATIISPFKMMWRLHSTTQQEFLFMLRRIDREAPIVRCASCL
jgi:hypothetical protein